LLWSEVGGTVSELEPRLEPRFQLKLELCLQQQRVHLLRLLLLQTQTRHSFHKKQLFVKHQLLLKRQLKPLMDYSGTAETAHGEADLEDFSLPRALNTLVPSMH
jgi:hypothetical protein